MIIIETDRLLLRTWKEEDAEPYYEMNQDPHFLEFLPYAISMEQAKEYVVNTNNRIAENGFSFFAVEEKESGILVGSLGLEKIEEPFPFAPAIEIGWRLAFPHWGKGYATEGARAVLEYGLKTLGLAEIVAYTFVENYRSQRIMEKIGMKRDFAGDFLHPQLPNDHRLAQSVLYRMNGYEFFQSQH